MILVKVQIPYFIGTLTERYYYHWDDLKLEGLAAISSERDLTATNAKPLLQAQGCALSHEISQMISWK